MIFTSKFLSNWKTIFWVISQEQHSKKTLEFTETNSYFYSFTYKKKNIFGSSSYQWVDFFVNLLTERKVVDSTPKYSLLAGDINQASIFFFPCIRYKWVNSIDWSTKLALIRQGLIYKNVFHQLKRIRKSRLEQHSNIPVFNLFVNWGLNVTNNINLNFQSMDELGKHWEIRSHFKLNIMN